METEAKWQFYEVRVSSRASVRYHWQKSANIHAIISAFVYLHLVRRFAVLCFGKGGERTHSYVEHASRSMQLKTLQTLLFITTLPSSQAINYSNIDSTARPAGARNGKSSICVIRLGKSGKNRSNHANGSRKLRQWRKSGMERVETRIRRCGSENAGFSCQKLEISADWRYCLPLRMNSWCEQQIPRDDSEEGIAIWQQTNALA